MELGKVYNHGGEECLGEVEYRLQCNDESGWWGELIFLEFIRIQDGTGYYIELSDGRRAACSLKKRVNKAVHGIPPRYYYYFRGVSRLEAR
ncbi:hypothetical protein ABFB09_03435 [Dehalogenimonas sp. THU2]|uniref:hypothetical protein n=1 Tax=Dehalogenimonas sp. THU2 TaxID=3151121 RepID=UPI003218BF4A